MYQSQSLASHQVKTQEPVRHSTSSIESLPDSLIRKVFGRCLPVVDSDLIWPYITRATKPSRILLSIRQVSKRWERIAESTPSLWTMIFVGELEDFCHYVVHPFLRLSKEEPLDIFIGLPFYGQFSHTLACLRKEFHRVRTFLARLSPKDLSIILLQEINEMPVATVIEITCVVDDEDEPDIDRYPHGGFIWAPNLACLKLSDASLADKVLGHLHSNDYRSIRDIFLKHRRPLSTLLQLLACCPNLQDLKLEGENKNAYHPNPWPQIRYSLPKLEGLLLRDFHTSDTVFFVRSLITPSLAWLGLHDQAATKDLIGRPPSEHTRALYHHFANECSKTLDCVVMEYTRIPLEITAINYLFGKLRSLEVLSIGKTHLPSGFLEAFIPDLRNPHRPCLCPLLIRLILREVDIEDDSVVRLIKSRCLSDFEWQLLYMHPEVVAIPSPTVAPHLRGSAALRSVMLICCSYAQDEVLGAILELKKTYSSTLTD
ncbi:hypothetical protein M422DRAFT_241278 [Sphaerobolus stellatus SS14]|nr:hypothetical protein M422DRAFT_241278 [Sphaerobolus stellatus SS14]